MSPFFVFLGLWAVQTLAQKCHVGICDVMIVTDRSSSIKRIKNGDRLERAFVEDLIKLQFEKYADPRVGLVRFDKGVQLDEELTGSEQKLHRTVDNWPGLGRGTHTHKGIKTARVELDDHARTPCRKMYVITDGKSTYNKRTVKEAKAAHARGIEVFAIGVGNADLKELKQIASKDENVYKVDTFQDADRVVVQNDDCIKNKPVDCTTVPVHVEGGTWQCNAPVKHDGRCNLVCDNQKIAGNGFATCKNGLWTDFLDEACGAAVCNVIPPAVKDGKWDCDPGLPKNSLDTCVLTCNHALLSGDGIVTCHDGKWTGTGDDVCEPATCPKQTFNYAGSTYKFTSTPMAWSMAQAEAVDMGGFLLSVSTKAEQDFVRKTIFKSSDINSREYWMGIFSDSATNGWQWASHAPFDYSNWEPGNGQVLNDQFGLINDEYVRVKRANHLAKWSTVANADETICGIIEIPPPLLCECNTPPQDKTCAPQECSTLNSKNIWSLLMCTFTMGSEFGRDWKETKPNQFTSNLGNGYTCKQASKADIARCP